MSLNDAQTTAEITPGDAPTPKEHLTFDRDKAFVWLESEQDPDIQAIKAKLVRELKCVGFDEFSEKADETIRAAVEQLANSNEKYAIFFDYKPHSSKRWIYELNQDCYQKYPPTEIGHFSPSWEKMSGNTRLRELTGSGVNTFLVSDDAAYSGEQIMNRQIEPIVKFYEKEGLAQKPKFVLAIPFVTSRFLKLVEDKKKEYGCEIEIHSNSVMPSLSEILTDEEKEILKARRGGNLETGNEDPTYLGATLTYFDHRVADDHSFSAEVRNALNLKADKPYSDETTEYFRRETAEFENYRNKVYPQ